MRVGAYARFWIESKALTVGSGTAERYVDALENHALPFLGMYYLDALRQVGPVSKKKQAPREYPLPLELAAVLREHRSRQLETQAAGLDRGWVFPSNRGTLKTPGSLWYAWRACLKAATMEKRFTVHGLRRTFNDLTRRAGVDHVVIESLTGHVTEKMRQHYSTVELSEKRAAVASVVRLVRSAIADERGERSGDAAAERAKAG